MSAGIRVDVFWSLKIFTCSHSSPVFTQWGQTSDKRFLQLPQAPVRACNEGGFRDSLWPLRQHSRGVGAIFNLQICFQRQPYNMRSLHSAPGIPKAWFCSQQAEGQCTHGDSGCEHLTFHPKSSQSNFPGSWDVNLAQHSGLHIILKRFLFPGLNSDPNRQLSQINTIPMSSAWIRHPTNYLLEFKEC